jgi:hypothetical protein
MPSRSKFLCCLYSIQNCISLAYRSAFTLFKMVAMQIMCRELYVISVCIPTLCRVVSHFFLCTHFAQNGTYLSLYIHFLQNGISFLSLSLSVPTLYKMLSHFCLCTHFVQNGSSFVSLYPLCTKWYLIFLSLSTHFVQNGISFLSLCTHFVQNVISFLSVYTHFVQNVISFLSVPTLYKMVCRFHLPTIFFVKFVIVEIHRV